MLDLTKLEGFDWDKGNLDKSRRKHDVTPQECEQIFVNRPVLLTHDPKHSAQEVRYKALGNTDDARLLCIAFTVRDRRIRIISARAMSRAERKIYDEET